MRGRVLAVLASLSLCGAWMTGDTHACLAAAVLIAPLLIDRLWKGSGLPPMEISTEVHRTQAGAPFLERARLRNTGRRPVLGMLISEPRIGVRGSGAYVEALPAGEQTTIELPSRVLRRGRYRERGFACESTYPLGLVRTRRFVVTQTELVCEPSRIALPHDVLQSTDDALNEPTPNAPRGAGEFYALHEYHYGEDARQVHALRSASTGTLVALDTRGQHQRHPCLVLDLRRPPGHAARGTGPQFEWSMSAAATLVDEFSHSAQAFQCVILGAPAGVLDVADSNETDALLAFLAEARSRVHAPVDDVLAEALRQASSCLWVPAGGYRADADRAPLRRAVLVTKELDA